MDQYTTIIHPSQAEYCEKRSRFLAFAVPVQTVEEAMAQVKHYEKEYYDARHVCYAYMLGADRATFRANDNGEPSGTAGRPILGQINSFGLTDLVVVVVRYFGGVKLGTSGLLQAYKTVAETVLAKAEKQARTVDCGVDVRFPYPLMNAVMRVVKDKQPKVVGQDFEGDCILHLQTRQSLAPELVEALGGIYGVKAELL